MTIQSTVVASTQVTVTTTAAALDQSTAGTRSILARNRGAVPVYLGGPSVTASVGYQLDPGEAITVDMPGFGGTLYGVTAASTARVDVLQVGRQ